MDVNQRINKLKDEVKIIAEKTSQSVNRAYPKINQLYKNKILFNHKNNHNRNQVFSIIRQL